MLRGNGIILNGSDLHFLQFLDSEVVSRAYGAMVVLWIAGLFSACQLCFNVC